MGNEMYFHAVYMIISGVTLHDLCPQDKGRARRLMELLLMVMEEKEQLTVTTRQS